jgi:hypothetical protein
MSFTTTAHEDGVFVTAEQADAYADAANRLLCLNLAMGSLDAAPLNSGRNEDINREIVTRAKTFFEYIDGAAVGTYDGDADGVSIDFLDLPTTENSYGRAINDVLALGAGMSDDTQVTLGDVRAAFARLDN